MITMFSQNDVNDINQVLSDVNFERIELYTVVNALDNYLTKLINQDSNEEDITYLEMIMDKFKTVIQTDLENEK